MIAYYFQEDDFVKRNFVFAYDCYLNSLLQEDRDNHNTIIDLLTAIFETPDREEKADEILYH